MNDIALYFRLIRFSARSQMQYRLSFCFQAVGQFVITSGEFLSLWALLHRFGQIRGWTLPEICFFYGTASIMFALADGISRGFDQFGPLVRSGEFDRLLLRPRSTVLQLLGHELTLRRIGRLAQGLAVIAAGMVWLPRTATLANGILLAWAVAGGMCLFLGLLVIQATVCFWTVESIEMMNVVTYGAVTTAQYPLSIYHSWLRNFFLFIVPLACVAFFPILGVLGRARDFGWEPAQVWFTPLAGPAFLIVALQIWRFGVRKYCSTGT
ncbi:MAG: ABC-2 family transporter protein [Chthoniobacteraceae bacterium]